MECQLCLIEKGKHKVQVEGLCGKHAEEVQEVLNWFSKNRKPLGTINLKKVSQKFSTKAEPVD